MKKISIALIAGILASIQFIVSFYNAGSTDTIIFLEVDIRIARAFWALLAVTCFITHYKRD